MMEIYCFPGVFDLVETLEKDEVLMNNKFAKQGVADMKLLLEYLDIYNVADKVRVAYHYPWNIR